MWSSWILYQQLTPIACLEPLETGQWKTTALRTRLTAPPPPSCSIQIYHELTAPMAPRAVHPAHPAHPLLKPSCKCGFVNHRSEDPHPQISLLLTTSEVNELSQSLPMPKTSSSNPPNLPPNLIMAFLRCLHNVLASTIPAELWMIN